MISIDSTIFRHIPGYEPYAASAEGRVKNTKTGRELKPSVGDGGYISFSVSPGSRRLLAHRAVALAWIGLPEGERRCVGHLDGNQKNNHVSNLAWVSFKENEHHKLLHGTRARGEKVGRSKLTTADVARIKSTYVRKSTELGSYALGREYGVDPKTITRILSGECWGHLNAASSNGKDNG